MILRHEILAGAVDPAACRRRILAFFESSLLIRYDRVEAESVAVFPATHPAFWPRIEQGETVNRETVASFFQELAREGDTSVDDFSHLPQGYKTSLLHSACHLLDGFFGVDSFFFNMEEDSHWVSPQLRQKIEAAPDFFFLLPVTATLSVINRGDDEAHALRKHFDDSLRQATRKI